MRNYFTLENGGERVDIKYDNIKKYSNFNIYQKSHYKRYEFANKNIFAGDIVGDMACGTGYGSVLISEKAKEVVAVDIDKKLIDKIKKRYKHVNNTKFICMNLLDLKYNNYFDKIISFETIEHFEESQILNVLSNFHNSMKQGGMLIFSVPYMQKNDYVARKMGFHKTFLIDENKIKKWLFKTKLELVSINYQNYQDHQIIDEIEKKDFIIITCKKN